MHTSIEYQRQQHRQEHRQCCNASNIMQKSHQQHKFCSATYKGENKREESNSAPKTRGNPLFKQKQQLQKQQVFIDKCKSATQHHQQHELQQKVQSRVYPPLERVIKLSVAIALAIELIITVPFKRHTNNKNNKSAIFFMFLFIFMSCNCRRQFGIALEINNNNKQQQQAATHANSNFDSNNNNNDNNSSQNDYDYTSNEVTPAAAVPAVATPPQIPISNRTETTNTTDSETENVDDKEPSEVQKAVCTVTAGDVRASAEAVTTKTLKGVCGSAEMNFALSNLEAKLYKELQDIKMLLQNVLEQANSGHKSMVQQQELIRETATEAATSRSQPAAPAFKFQPIEATKVDKKPNIAEVVPSKMPTSPSPKLKSLPVLLHQRNTHYREQEVNKFNNTLLSDRDFKVFTYYWKIENFTERIESGISATTESPVFSIKGKILRIVAQFQHLHRDFLYLQLEYASLNTGNRNNIILDMGGLFKEITNEKMHFKHKISVLDQHNTQRTKDLISQEFLNLDNGFLIPNSALLSSSYIKDNALLVQIFLYL